MIKYTANTHTRGITDMIDADTSSRSKYLYIIVDVQAQTSNIPNTIVIIQYQAILVQ